jgi:hypothetical protein
MRCLRSVAWHERHNMYIRVTKSHGSAGGHEMQQQVTMTQSSALHRRWLWALTAEASVDPAADRPGSQLPRTIRAMHDLVKAETLQIVTYEEAWPLLKDGGVYICEDTSTSMVRVAMPRALLAAAAVHA